MGFATADRLASSGCRVAIVDLDPALAEKAAGALRQGGAEAVGIGTDVTVEDEVNAAVTRAAAAIGTPELSASVVGRATAFKPLLDMSLADWDRDQRMNLLPMFLIGTAMARALTGAGKRGALAFVSSVSGLQAAHQHGSYGAAKRGMMSLAETMAAEWGPAGIRVNTVAPGAIHTDRVQPSEAMIDLLGRKVPAGRFARVEEMASCLCFLLSDLASYVNGQTLVADGGWMTVPAVLPSDNPLLEKI